MRYIQTKGHKLDTNQIYSLNYPFNRKLLVDIFNEIEYTTHHWPWLVNEPGSGWYRRGWRFHEVAERKKIHPYIAELVDFFGFEYCAIWYFHNTKTFNFPIHTDSNSYRAQPDGEYKKLSKDFAGKPDNYEEIKGKGSLASLNVLLSEEWCGDKTPQACSFTYENQFEMGIDPLDYWKTENDYHYAYHTALLNTNWPHYLGMDGVNERLLFRFSIYQDDFFTAKERLKQLGL